MRKLLIPLNLLSGSVWAPVKYRFILYLLHERVCFEDFFETQKEIFQNWLKLMQFIDRSPSCPEKAPRGETVTASHACHVLYILIGSPALHGEAWCRRSAASSSCVAAQLCLYLHFIAYFCISDSRGRGEFSSYFIKPIRSHWSWLRNLAGRLEMGTFNSLFTMSKWHKHTHTHTHRVQQRYTFMSLMLRVRAIPLK